jgi:hypothetical protein
MYPNLFTMNDPIAELRAEYGRKKHKLDTLKKDIKQNPDQRYINRKEFGAELNGLKDAICERLNEGDEVTVGTRRFKKQRVEKVHYNKESITAYCSRRGDSLDSYNKESKEEQIVLKPI